MITKLFLSNFQNHDALSVKVGSGVTTIVGSSDKGKSAIFRALRACMLNVGSGEGMIKHGTDGYAVRVMIVGGTGKILVGRMRGKEGNLYYLGKTEFKAFGLSVPEPIEKALRLCEINFQAQHDSPFWLSLAPGQVAKELNEATELDLLDRVVARITRDSKLADHEYEATKESIQIVQTERDKLNWVLAANDYFKIVKELKADSEAVHDKTTILNEKIENARKLSERAKRLGAMSSRAALLAGRKRHLDRKRADITTLRKAIAAIKEMKKSVVVPDTTVIRKKREVADNATRSRQQLEQLIQFHKDKEEEKCLLQEKLKEAQSDLPETCPTCNQKVQSPSQWSSPICTSPTRHRSPGRENPIGLKPKKDT